MQSSLAVFSRKLDEYNISDLSFYEFNFYSQKRIRQDKRRMENKKIKEESEKLKLRFSANKVKEEDKETINLK